MNTVKSTMAIGMVALAPGIAWATGGITGTDHDFTTAHTPTTLQAVGTCTFCHTPHKALSTLLLWNHTLSTNTFSWDVPKTTAGTTFPTFKGDTYSGPTAKCLSCHDGSVAIGDIAWFLEVGYPGGTGMNTARVNLAHQTATITGGMKGNHPTAMPYPYNNAANTYNTSTTGPGIVLVEWQADPTANGIKMYNDDGAGNITAGTVAGKTGIECSSCHEPHNGAAAVDDKFLRGKLTGTDKASGYLCQQCHIK